MHTGLAGLPLLRKGAYGCSVSEQPSMGVSIWFPESPSSRIAQCSSARDNPAWTGPRCIFSHRATQRSMIPENLSIGRLLDTTSAIASQSLAPHGFRAIQLSARCCFAFNAEGLGARLGSILDQPGAAIYIVTTLLHSHQSDAGCTDWSSDTGDFEE